MWQTDDVKDLVTALTEAQKEFPVIPKDKIADMKTYTYKYSDLATVISCTTPTLTKHGLSITQTSGFTELGEFVLITTLNHKSGQWRRGWYPLPAKSTPQDIGKAMTYARRYTWSAMIGVASEEDTDAKGVDGEKKPAGSTDPINPPKPKRDYSQPQGAKPATDKQVNMIKLKAKQLGWTMDQLREHMLAEYNKPDDVPLSADDASKLIDHLVKLLKAPKK